MRDAGLERVVDRLDKIVDILQVHTSKPSADKYKISHWAGLNNGLEWNSGAYCYVMSARLELSEMNTDFESCGYEIAAHIQADIDRGVLARLYGSEAERGAGVRVRVHTFLKSGRRDEVHVGRITFWYRVGRDLPEYEYRTVCPVGPIMDWDDNT